MSIQRKRAWQVLILWGIVFLIFLPLYFSGSGADEWGIDHNSRFLSSVVLGLGYVIFFVLQVKGRKIRKDEREYLIELKASQAAMISILLYVFIFGITMFVIYESKVFMPASWMWFLAYTTVFLAYISNSAFYLWFEKKMDGYGKY